MLKIFHEQHSSNPSGTPKYGLSRKVCQCKHQLPEEIQNFHIGKLVGKHHCSCPCTTEQTAQIYLYSMLMGLSDSYDMNHLYISGALIKNHKGPPKDQERSFTTKDGGAKAWMSTSEFWNETEILKLNPCAFSQTCSNLPLQLHHHPLISTGSFYIQQAWLSTL